jgi:hypothetical protein
MIPLFEWGCVCVGFVSEHSVKILNHFINVSPRTVAQNVILVPEIVTSEVEVGG